MDHNGHSEAMARELDSIRNGGAQVVVMIRQRIGMALDALDEGHFGRLSQYLSLAQEFADSLSHAQKYLGIAEGSHLVRAVDVEVGMEMTGLGEVAEREVDDCPVCGTHVKLKIEGHELGFHGNTEVFVLNGAA